MSEPKRKINRIFIHTSASYNKKAGGVLDPSAADIRKMHITERGWKDIGYHRVIRRNGKIEMGRDDDLVGAGVAWANMDTLHVCCSGAGDYEDFTDAQKKSLCSVVYDWLREYDIVGKFIENPFRVIGHNEVNALVAAGVYPEKARTTKSCPGKKVDMAAIRTMIVRYVLDAEKKRNAGR